MWYWKWQRFRVGIRGISHNNLRALLMLESLTSNNHLWALHCWMPTPLALTIVLDVADVQIRFSHNYLGALKVFYNVLYLDKKTQKASKTIQEKPGLKNRKSILVYCVGV